MIFKGFKLGILLQLAIGPVCIFIFQIASLGGILNALIGILGVLIIDGLYILAAILGIASIIERKNIKMVMKILGAAILFVFGISTVLSVFSIDFIPGICTQNNSDSNSVFFRAIVLAASNPLTIIFWAGIFSSRIVEENMQKNEIYFFGLGALLSTMFFLTSIAVAGNLTKVFFPPYIIQILNLIAGFLLMYFSIRMISKKS